MSSWGTWLLPNVRVKQPHHQDNCIVDFIAHISNGTGTADTCRGGKSEFSALALVLHINFIPIGSKTPQKEPVLVYILFHILTKTRKIN